MQKMQEIKEQLAAAKTPEEKTKLQLAADSIHRDPEYKKQAELADGALIKIQQLEIRDKNNEDKIQQLEKSDKAIQDVEKVRKKFEDGSSPEIKKAQDEYQDLDGSNEAYEKYAKKYQDNNFDKDLKRVVPATDSDDDL